MLEISANKYNAIVRYNGVHKAVIQYHEDYLRKYSELYLYKWTEEKILNELHYAIKGELQRALPEEDEDRLDKVASLLLTYAKANIHDPRKEEGKTYKVIFEYRSGRTGICEEDGKVKLFNTKQEAAAYASDLNNRIEENMKPFLPTYRAVEA